MTRRHCLTAAAVAVLVLACAYVIPEWLLGSPFLLESLGLR